MYSISNFLACQETNSVKKVELSTLKGKLDWPSGVNQNNKKQGVGRFKNLSRKKFNKAVL